MVGRIGQRRGGRQAAQSRRRSNTDAPAADYAPPAKRTRGRPRAKIIDLTDDDPEDSITLASSPANDNFTKQLAQLSKSTPSTVLDHKKFTTQVASLESTSLDALRSAHDSLINARKAQQAVFANTLAEINPSDKSDYAAFTKMVLAPLDALIREIKKNQDYLDDYILNNPNGKRILKDCKRGNAEAFFEKRKLELEEEYENAVKGFTAKVAMLREKVREGGVRLGGFYEVFDREI